MLIQLVHKTKTLAKFAMIAMIAMGVSLASSASANAQTYGGNTYTNSGGNYNGGGSPGSRFGATDPDFAQGVESFEKGHYRSAEAHFRNSLIFNGRSAQGHFMLGRTYAAVEQWSAASRAFRTALRDDTNHHSARYMLAVSHLAAGRIEAANKQLGKLDRVLATCDDACDFELVNAVGMLRTAITEQNS